MEKSTSQTALPAAIYCRISRDRAGGGLGVERQEADCRALAERLGWNVAAVFVDNDMSAYSGAPRREYRAMLEAVRSGRVQGIVAWHTDRLHRRATELEEFVTVAEAHNLQVETVTSGKIDLTTAAGRMYARHLGNIAHYEVDHARERMKRAKDQMALDGKYRGGPRPYGYERDGLTIREDEAAVIREATEAVLAGRSLASVARELTEANRLPHREVRKRDETGAVIKGEYVPRVRIDTRNGEPIPEAWTYSMLRDVLTRPRNAGLLAQGRADRGILVVGCVAKWPAILDEETWRACFALLTDSSRRNHQATVTRWLGSGHYLCGLCGSPLRVTALGGTPSRANIERKYHYRCEANSHLTIAQWHTDDYVRSVVADLVRDPRVAAAMHPTSDVSAADRARRAVLVARLAGFETDYAEGAVTGPQLAKATARVNAELAEVDERISASVRRSTASPVMDAPDPGQAFLDAPIDVQRAVLRAVINVEVLPSPTRGSVWTAERVSITPVVAA